jgi:hypothetical protein
VIKEPPAYWWRSTPPVNCSALTTHVIRVPAGNSAAVGAGVCFVTPGKGVLGGLRSQHPPPFVSALVRGGTADSSWLTYGDFSYSEQPRN